LSEPTACVGARCHHDSPYCSRCDLLVGLAGLHVLAVDHDADEGRLVVRVESPPELMGCASCGVVAYSHGRREVILVDAPCFGRPVRVVWRKRTWRCVEPSCSVKTFTEQAEEVAAPRALLTRRACWWAIGQIRREHASVRGIARQPGTTWNTVWTSIQPLLEAMAADESRFAGVARLGVDEHVWHHVSTKPIEEGGRGPKELTGMVDLTPDADGNPRARLLDLVPGWSGKAYSDWLQERGGSFRNGVKEATLDPFHGYKNAIDDQLEDATAVLDAFHVVKRGTPGSRRGPPPGPARDPRPPRPHERPAVRDPHHPPMRGREAHRATTSTARPRDRR
jgi:transposase